MKSTVRCPYCVSGLDCVSGLEFRHMVAHVDGRHICNKCVHTTHPSDAQYDCLCINCQKLGSVGSRLFKRPVKRAG
jgi:hypothetical protein